MTWKRPITKSELETLYLIDGKTTVQISKMIDVPRTSLDRWRKEWGIPTKNRSPQESGMRFGRLTLIDYQTSGKRGTATKCRCRCDCGEEVVVLWGNLQQGFTQSCGCLNTDRLRREGSTRNRILQNDYKGASAKRGIFWGLTDETAFALFQSNCHYCGAPPSRTRTYPRCIEAYTFNGIDRLDPKLGYVPGNVAACCPECNYAKGQLPEAAFLAGVGRLLPTPSLKLRADSTGLTASNLGYPFSHYRCNAKTVSRPFTLQPEQVIQLVSSPCYYCGGAGHIYPQARIVRNGIDRLDPTLGYDLSNCVPCCWTCNRLKGKRQVPEFLAWAERLQRFQATAISTR